MFEMNIINLLHEKTQASKVSDNINRINIDYSITKQTNNGFFTTSITHRSDNTPTFRTWNGTGEQNNDNGLQQCECCGIEFTGVNTHNNQ